MKLSIMIPVVSLSRLAILSFAISATQVEAGSLYVTDTAGKLFQFNSRTGTFIASTTGGGLVNPLGVVISPEGRVLVSSHNSNPGIFQYDATSLELLGKFASTSSGQGDDLKFGPDGCLYVDEFNAIGRYSGQTGERLGTVATVNDAIVGLAFGPDGHLYASGANYNQIFKINVATDQVLTTYTSRFLNRASGIAFGRDGALYVASQFSDVIVRLDTRTGESSRFAYGAQLRSPSGVAFGPDGNLYVTSMMGGGVTRHSPMNGAFIDQFVSPTASGLGQAAQLVFSSPIAVAAVSPSARLFANMTSPIAIAANGIDAELIFDGTRSVNVEDDLHSFAWFADGALVPFAIGAVATNRLGVGSHTIRLAVNDLGSSHTAVVDLEVVTLGAAVELIIQHVAGSQLPRNDKTPLLKTLQATAAAFDRQQTKAGMNQLRVLQNKIMAQAGRENSPLAAELINAVDVLLNSERE